LLNKLQKLVENFFLCWDFRSCETVLVFNDSCIIFEIKSLGINFSLEIWVIS
jgi:hypothetical protein